MPRHKKIRKLPMTAPYVPQMALYRQWLKESRGLAFADFEAMRRWSVTDIDGF